MLPQGGYYASAPKGSGCEGEDETEPTTLGERELGLNQGPEVPPERPACPILP